MISEQELYRMQTFILVEDDQSASCDKVSTELAELRFQVEKPPDEAAADRS